MLYTVCLSTETHTNWFSSYCQLVIIFGNTATLYTLHTSFRIDLKCAVEQHLVGKLSIFSKNMDSLSQNYRMDRPTLNAKKTNF